MSSLQSRTACDMLDTIAATLGLNNTELADVFGLRRSSLSAWRMRGIPKTRRASVERVVDLANVLAEEIIATRIPELVRTRDPRLDHRSILETIARDGVEPVYAYLYRIFSYAD